MAGLPLWIIGKLPRYSVEKTPTYHFFREVFTIESGDLSRMGTASVTATADPRRPHIHVDVPVTVSPQSRQNGHRRFSNRSYVFGHNFTESS